MKEVITKFYNGSITHKIMWMVMSIIVSIFILSFLSFLTYDVYFNTRQAIRNEVDLVARAVSKRAAPVMLFEDEFEGNKVISEASIKDSIILACLYTNRNTLLSQYRQETDQESYCPPIAPEKMGIISTLRTIAIHKAVTSPNGEKVASVYIVSDMRQILEKLYETSLGAILFLAIASLVAYELATKVTTIITTPILNLAQTAKSVSRNNYSARATKMYDDECGLLTDTFNSMMQKVEHHKEMLNQIVNKRTKDLRHTVKKLESSNEELEKASRLKQLWIQNMGHEIRTPIHQVLQFSTFGMKEYADKDVPREDIGNYFSRIHTSANRLCKLIEGLLDFGKLQSGKINIDPNINDIRETVLTVAEEIDGMAADKNIRINICEADFNTNIVFDNNRISQVLINLLVNAIKFSPKDGLIEVIFDKAKMGHKDVIKVSVKDYGIGIPEGEENDIFDTFTQSSKTYDGSGGTGLGLSISKEIILLHQGTIYAKNNGKNIEGATFTFTLPFTETIEGNHGS